MLSLYGEEYFFAIVDSGIASCCFAKGVVCIHGFLSCFRRNVLLLEILG